MRKQLLTQVMAFKRLLLTGLLLLAVGFTTNAQSILDDYVAAVTLTCGTDTATSLSKMSETRFTSDDSVVFAQSFTTGSDVTTDQMLFETGGTGEGISLKITAGTLEISAGSGNNVDITVPTIAANTQYSYVFIADFAGNLLEFYLQSGTLDPTSITTGSATKYDNTSWADVGINGTNGVGVCQVGDGFAQSGDTALLTFLGTGGDVVVYEPTATILANVYEDASGNADGVEEDTFFINLLPNVSGAVSGADYLTGLQAAFGAGDISNPVTEAEIQAVITARNAETQLTGYTLVETVACGFDGANFTIGVDNNIRYTGSVEGNNQRLVATQSFTTGADVTTAQILFETGGTNKGVAVELKDGNLTMYTRYQNITVEGIAANTQYTYAVVADIDLDVIELYVNQAASIDLETLSIATADLFASNINYSATGISGGDDMGVCIAGDFANTPATTGAASNDPFLGTGGDLMVYRETSKILETTYEDASGDADGIVKPAAHWTAIGVANVNTNRSYLPGLQAAFAEGNISNPTTVAEIQAVVDAVNAQGLLDGHLVLETFAAGYSGPNGSVDQSLRYYHFLEGANGTLGTTGVYGAFSQTFTTGADVTTPQLLFETGGSGIGTAIEITGGVMNLYTGDGNDIDLSISGIQSNTTYTYLYIGDVENDLVYLLLTAGDVDPTTMTPENVDDFASLTAWGETAGIDGGNEMGVTVQGDNANGGVGDNSQGGTRDPFLGTGGDLVVYIREAAILESIYEDASGNADGIFAPLEMYTAIGVTGKVDTNIMELAYNEGFQNALADGALSNPATVAEIQAVVDAVNAEDDLILAGLVADETIAASTTDYTSLASKAYYQNSRLVLAHSFTTGADVTTPQHIFDTGGSGTGIAVNVNAGNLEFYLVDNNNMDIVHTGAIAANTDYSYIIIVDVVQDYAEVYLQSGTLDPTTMRPSTASVEVVDNFTENSISGAGTLAIGGVPASEDPTNLGNVQGGVTDPFLGTVGDVTVYFSTSNEVVPVITVTAGTDSVVLGTAHTDAGATANDDIDGDVSANITVEDTVDTNNVGTYTITYSVYDSAGNKAVRTRSVEVTPKELTITGLTGDNKIYDGTTAATLTGGSLSGIVNSQDVSIDASGATNTFAAATVGTGVSITSSGYALSGADAGNYTLAQPTGLSADITAKGLTITGLTGENKEYDGATTATTTGTAALDGVVGSDAVSIDASGASHTFAAATVATGVSITSAGYALSGADAGNYTLAQPTGLSADITAKELTVSGLTGDNKEYDGATTATVTGTATLNGVVGSDAVSIDGSSASHTFAAATVGTGVSITSAGYALSGADAGNYTIAQPTGLSADITAKGLTITGLTGDNKEYDGATTASASGTATLNGVVGSDVVSVDASGATNTFAAATVGTGVSITSAGYALSGADAGNYTVAQPTGLSADITAKELTITGLTGDNKQYDGTTNATVTGTATLNGVVGSDAVSIDASGASHTFAAAAVATGVSITSAGYALSGADAGNYTLAQPTGLTADITGITLTITGLTGDNKEYDGATTASASGTATLNGVVGSDAVSIDASGATHTFAAATVATGVSITSAGYALSGADAGNYTLTQPSGLTADITAKGLTITGLTGENKEYDGTTDATVTGTAALDGVVGSDDVSIDASGATHTFAAAAVATGVSITSAGYALSGADAGNYTLTQPTGLTADITADVTPPTFDVDGNTADFITNIAVNGTYTVGTIQNIVDVSTPTTSTITGDGAVDTSVPGASYMVTYEVEDAATNSTTITETVNIGGDTEDPVITSGTTGTDLAENSGANQTVYTATATDNIGVVGYTLGGDDADKLSVTTGGVVTLDADPDFETQSSYSFTIRAQDAAGNNSAAVTVTFSITDVVEFAVPTAGATAPTAAAGDVASLFSDTYTSSVTVTNFGTSWSNDGAGPNLEDVDLSGNNVKKYSDLNYVGVDLSASDVSSYEYFHIDVWTPNATEFTLRMVDFLGDGFAGGNGDVQFDVSTTVAGGDLESWVSIDIALSDFTGVPFTDLNQILFIAQPSGSAVVYVDNMYFYNIPTIEVGAGENMTYTSDINTDVSISDGGTVTLADGVTINGDVTISGGSGLLAPNGSITGTVTYIRTVPTTNWYLISSPVAGQDIDAFVTASNLATGTGNNVGFSDYNNTTGAWSYYQSGASGTGNFVSGEGHAVKLNTAGDISFSGSFNNADASISVSTNTNGFNLIGNPYLASVSVVEMLNANNALLTEQTVWLWDQAADAYVQKNLAADLEVAPGQGFFVSANAGGNFSITEAMQSLHTDTFQRTVNTRPEVSLTLSNGEVSRTAEIFYINGTTKGFDNGYDSSIFEGFTNEFAVYTRAVANGHGRNLGIQSLPQGAYESMIVPVGVNAVAGSSLEFSARSANLPSGTYVYLEDKNTNTFTRIDNATYRVTASSDLNGVGQFYIHTTSSVLAAPTNTLDNVSVYASNNETLKVEGITEGQAQVRMYSILGKQVINTTITGNGNNRIALPKLQTGVYLVEVQSAQGTLNKKLIIE